MNYGIAFTPLVPSLVLWLALAAIAVIAALLLLGRSRGAALRVAALALIVLALANPSFTREDREPLSSVAVVVIDKSPSQNFGERQQDQRQRGDAHCGAACTADQQQRRYRDDRGKRDPQHDGRNEGGERDAVLHAATAPIVR